MVAASRRFVTDVLPDMDPQARDAIELMVSELASNALTHAVSAFEVVVEISEGSIRVEVRDDGPGQPTMRFPDHHEPHGRGLQVVGRLSDEWGSTAEAGGKQVWFTLDFRAGNASEEPHVDESLDIGRPDEPETASVDALVEGASETHPQMLAA